MFADPKIEWQNFKSARIFQIEPRRLSASLESFNSSLALYVGKLWLDKVQAISVALRS